MFHGFNAGSTGQLAIPPVQKNIPQVREISHGFKGRFSASEGYSMVPKDTPRCTGISYGSDGYATGSRVNTLLEINCCPIVVTFCEAVTRTLSTF